MSRHFVVQLYELINNPVFLSAFCSWFTAQFIKTLIDVSRRKTRQPKDFLASLIWRTGGMPSSHSAVVTALSTSIGLMEGINSALFIMALFYCILTIRDALGVRRSAGTQSQALNQLGEELKHRIDVRFKPVKEINGHTGAEVSVGIILGFFIALAFCYL